MKKIKLLILLSTICFSGFSQNKLKGNSLLPIKYGVKFGANIANMSSSSNEGTKILDVSYAIGLAGGFYMEIALNEKWYINPELIYIQKGGSYSTEYTHYYEPNLDDKHKTAEKIELAYIELNPILSYKTSEKLSLNIGPSISFLLTPSYTVNEKNDHDSQGFHDHEELDEAVFEEESLDIGVNFGISYYLSENFLLNSRVNTGLMKIGKITKEISTDGSADNDIKENIFELKNNGIQFSIIYLF